MTAALSRRSALPAGELVWLCVYKGGAVELARRLSAIPPSSASCLREEPPEIRQGPGRALPELVSQGGKAYRV